MSKERVINIPIHEITLLNFAKRWSGYLSDSNSAGTRKIRLYNKVRWKPVRPFVQEGSPIIFKTVSPIQPPFFNSIDQIKERTTSIRDAVPIPTRL
jgi:hypothetical protein